MKERCYRGSWSKREAVRTWWQSQGFQKTQIKLNSSTQKSKKKMEVIVMDGDGETKKMEIH